jgi:hypothetical protein
VIVQRIAFALLAILGLVLGVNLIASSSRFTTAYDVYDQLGLELEQFAYTSPQDPVETTLRVSNPSGQTIKVLAIELRLSAGVHRVGGGELRPEQTFPPRYSEAYSIPIHINDRDYIERLGTNPIDWRVSGRIQVLLDEALDPVWIPFVVRYIE